MHSRRIPDNLSPNATARAADALRARGVDIIDLTASNPTRVGLSYPDHLLTPLAHCRGLDYLPHPLGLLSAREAVAHDYSRRAVAVPASRVALTASTSEAYAFLFKLFCDPGDDVLVPRPSYPLFEHLTRLEGVTSAPYSLEYHGGWRIDFDSLRHAVSSRTRAVLVVSPNNPTGSFLHGDDLVALGDFCATNKLALIGDEVFADYAHEPVGTPPSVLALEDVITCSLGGLSKSVGLPQLKLAWIVFGGPQARVSDLLNVYEVIADAYLSVSTPVQAAAPELLHEGAAIRRQIQQRVAQNLSRLRALLVDYPAVTVLRCEGGWSAVVQLPALRDEEQLILELLTGEHVLVHPGFFFDFDRDTFVIVSLLVEPARFELGVSRMLARATATPVEP